MRNRPFRRLWVALGLSSLGNWLGLLATGLFARNLFEGSAAQGAAFGGVIVVRLLPALLPLAGVLADRFDRRLTMVVSDALRFALFASIPLAGMVLSPGPAVTWALVATFLTGTITMLWMPAQEAAVPDLVPGRVGATTRLTLVTTYGITPVIAALLLACLSRAMLLLAGNDPSRLPVSPVDVALYLTALTFLAAAVVVWTIRGIGRPAPREGTVARGTGLFGSLLDGWRFMRGTPMARGLLLDIGGAFAAGGVVVGVAPFYASSLGGGDATFAILFAVVFLGLAAGMALGPTLVRTLSRRRWFALSIAGAGAAVTALAVAPHLAVAVPLAALVGVGAGMAFLAGTTLLGAEVADDVRGRMFAFVQSAGRVVLMIAITLASVLGGVGGSRRVAGLVPINTSRVLLLVAGLLAIGAGVVAFRRMDDRPGVPVLRDLLAALRGRPLGRPVEERYPDGLFVVFEGGEGAGKSTQAVKLAAWLRVEGGRETVLTREPGATQVGARIRGILLDKSSDGLAPRAEALLYAADRAHHVASVIRPALARGEVVISDRYIDSSLAYQGAGRALPTDEIAWLSEWATGGLVPDLVVLLDVAPSVGLGRVSERGEADRLEAEATTFHQRVRESFLDLATMNSQRYLVLDASGDPDALADAVRQRVSGLLAARTPGVAPADRDAAEPVPAGAVPADAAPAEPDVVVPVPAGAVPADAVPAEPDVVVPVPAGAVPADAAPAEPDVVVPVPADAVPAEPDVVVSVPADAVPAEPVTAGAVPTDPGLAVPAAEVPAGLEPDAETTAPIPLPIAAGRPRTAVDTVDPAETTAVMPIVTAPEPSAPEPSEPGPSEPAAASPRADATLVMPAIRDEPADGADATKSFPAVKEKTLTSPDTTEELPRPAVPGQPVDGGRDSRRTGTGQ
jgi:dTMP kinase